MFEKKKEILMLSTERSARGRKIEDGRRRFPITEKRALATCMCIRDTLEMCMNADLYGQSVDVTAKDYRQGNIDIA